MPGQPDWGGTALVHGIDILADGFGVTMGPGQTIAFPPFTITRPGYLLNIGTTYSGASGTTPLMALDMSWLDSGQNVHFGHEMWEMAVGTLNNGFFHTGRGPTKGQLLAMSFTNVDSVQNMESVFWLAQTTQHASRDDIRVHLDGVSPVWATAPLDIATENELAAIKAGTLTASNSITYLLPLYSGQAYLFWSASGQSAANVFSIEIFAASGSGNQPDIYNSSAGASPFTSVSNQLLTLPRRCCLLKISNTGTSTVTYNLYLAAQEYSS